MTFTSAFSVGH